MCRMNVLPYQRRKYLASLPGRVVLLRRIHDALTEVVTHVSLKCNDDAVGPVCCVTHVK